MWFTRDSGKFDRALSPPGRSLLFLLLFFPLILALSRPALAHKVYIFAWVEGDTVHTDSYFPKSRKVKGGRVEVFGPSGRKLLEGTTDDQGAFSFKVPQKSDLRLLIDAGSGHQGEFLLETEELPAAAGEPRASGLSRPEAKTMTTSSTPQPDQAQIKKIVEEALDARLKPIARSLAELRKEQGPGLSEIIGGLGYIFGIMGLIMYLRSRNKNN